MSGRPLVHWKPRGSKRWTMGIYTWRKSFNAERLSGHRGYVLRLGPWGHFQWQTYRRYFPNGRRPLRGVQLSSWGIAGRRGKRYIQLAWSTGKRGDAHHRT